MNRYAWCFIVDNSNQIITYAYWDWTKCRLRLPGFVLTHRTNKLDVLCKTENAEYWRCLDQLFFFFSCNVQLWTAQKLHVDFYIQFRKWVLFSVLPLTVHTFKVSDCSLGRKTSNKPSHPTAELCHLALLCMAESTNRLSRKSFPDISMKPTRCFQAKYITTLFHLDMFFYLFHITPPNGGRDVWCLPTVWNLRAVIWFHFTISSLVFLPSSVTLSVFFSPVC